LGGFNFTLRKSTHIFKTQGATMGYVFNFQDARSYAQWLGSNRNQSAAELESQLMFNLLNPATGESILEIGCGTGVSMASLIRAGLDVTGIDPSPYMLDIASENLGQSADLYRGFAEDLPFDDNSFNHTCFLTSLEFVEDPVRAVEEACRVAKDKVFIGFLNRFALKGVQRRVQGVFSQSIYNRARFFSVWELKGMVRSLVGGVPVQWRTVLQLPNASARLVQTIEQSGFVQRSPFGAFAGLVVTLVPRFRTRSLAMRCSAKKTTTALSG
jgi:ubiquinone/menaquinone biosynthesis C-methylase UbiE